MIIIRHLGAAQTGPNIYTKTLFSILHLDAYILSQEVELNRPI